MSDFHRASPEMAWLCDYVYAELQMNQLKPKIVIEVLTESCVGCETQYMWTEYILWVV